jgi:hypothetical protein
MYRFPAGQSRCASRRLGISWLLLVTTVAAHIADEAMTGFLGIYNPTVLELRRNIPWIRLPTFTFRAWLSGLIVALVIAMLATPLAFRAPRSFRVVAVVCAVFMILNGLNHLLGTALGHTFSDIRFARPMPGTYSSPPMIAAAVYLLVVGNPFEQPCPPSSYAVPSSNAAPRSESMGRESCQTGEHTRERPRLNLSICAHENAWETAETKEISGLMGNQ